MHTKGGVDMKRKSKKSKQNIFKRLLSAFLLCIIPFTFVGCMGDNDPDEEYDPESSFIGNLMSVDMYGCPSKRAADGGSFAYSDMFR